MRLRLRIHRHELPTVSTLWPVSETQLNNTVAQLLKQVNNTFPIEAETWGLEQYAVSIGGFECLHYHELGAVCKDEDEVVIKPLQYAEVRARTLTGRDQISADGRHLVDGVPFGRPLLKGVCRPEVRIPPRKRRRLETGMLEDGGVEGSELSMAGALVRTGDAGEDLVEEDEDDNEDEDENEDEDFEIDAEEVTSEDERLSAESSDEDDNESSDDSSDTSESTSDSDRDLSEELWEGFDSKVKPATPINMKPVENKTAVSRSSAEASISVPVSTGQAKPELQSGQQSLTLKRKQPSDDLDPRSEQQPTSMKKAKLVPPGQGDSKTKERNARRRDQKKLNHLKQTGVLPESANLAALREWAGSSQRLEPRFARVDAPEMEAGHTITQSAGKPGYTVAAVENDMSKDHQPAVSGTERATHEGKPIKSFSSDKAGQATKLEEQRQQLIEAIASGGIEVTREGKKSGRKLIVSSSEDDEPPEEMSAKEASAPVQTDVRSTKEQDMVVGNVTKDATAGAAMQKSTDMVPASVARRSKLDLASSKRLLFGSLGMRVPKTQADRDALQQKLAGRNTRNTSTTEKPPPPAPAGADHTEASETGQTVEEDPESWRDKINLTAVECCDEGVTLVKPPFPFHQRWDPQYRRKKSKGRDDKQHMAPRKRQKTGRYDQAANGEHHENYDKYNTDGYGDALDYDDAVEDDEYWEEGALLDGEYEDDGDGDAAAQQLLDETTNHQHTEEDDLPPLPDDLATLPPLVENDVQKNDFFVYKELSCSAATGWQPTMLTRTAQLLDKRADGWMVKLALRDRRPKEYDESGNRVYRKFEMEGLSDDEGEGDGSERTITWAEMLEPRLLLRSVGG